MLCIKIFLSPIFITPNRTHPTLAHLVEHLTVVVYQIVFGSNQMVAGSIPASRNF